MTDLHVSGTHQQVLGLGDPDLHVSGQFVQVLRALKPPDLYVSNHHVQALIGIETVSAGAPIVTAQRKIPGLGWTNLRPKRAQ